MGIDVGEQVCRFGDGSGAFAGGGGGKAASSCDARQPLEHCDLHSYLSSTLLALDMINALIVAQKIDGLQSPIGGDFASSYDATTVCFIIEFWRSTQN